MFKVAGCLAHEAYGRHAVASSNRRSRTMLYAAAVKVKTQFTNAPSAMTEFPQTTDGLHPAEALLDELPLLLTDHIAGVSRRPRVDRAPAAGRVLRDVRRDEGLCGAWAEESGSERRKLAGERVEA